MTPEPMARSSAEAEEARYWAHLYGLREIISDHPWLRSVEG
ncbi:hypothetical protein ACWF0M_09300 [Kribbella sp. NPDC055110]